MSKYVDIEPYDEYVLQRHYRNSMGECIETVPLCGLPIADVQEVRHGRWLYDDGAMHRCSVCGELSCCTSHYCGECGAKMDEEEQE